MKQPESNLRTEIGLAVFMPGTLFLLLIGLWFGALHLTGGEAPEMTPEYALLNDVSASGGSAEPSLRASDVAPSATQFTDERSSSRMTVPMLATAYALPLAMRFGLSTVGR